VHLLSYVVKCTATDSLLNTQTSCSKCPPSAWIPFLTRVTRKLVTLVTLTPVFLPYYGRIERPELVVKKKKGKAVPLQAWTGPEGP